jgi:hypothetical protein
LQRSFRDEYVLMVAQAFALDGDLPAAESRLRGLDADEPAAAVVDLARRLESDGGRAEDVAVLTTLATELAPATDRQAVDEGGS